jgi:sterol desaturase/sphingolipid hydroxylase (fatty acid hydroxylase superfamily)
MFGPGSVAGIPVEWLPFGAFWALLIVLAGAEQVRPFHLDPSETKGRLTANFGLGIAAAALAAFLPLSNVIAGQWAQDRDIGLLHLVPMSAAAAFAITLVVRSFAAYLLHRLDHAVPLLWRIHRVHHCDTAVDVSTSFRAHPSALVIQAIWLAAVAILLGASVPALIVYEVLAGGFSLWSHANLRLPDGVEKTLRLLLITPQMHHVHHSAAREETDSNFGDVFSFWDRLCGTYRQLSAEELARTRIGLGPTFDPGAGSLFHQLRAPLAADPVVRQASPSEA